MTNEPGGPDPARTPRDADDNAPPPADATLSDAAEDTDAAEDSTEDPTTSVPVDDATVPPAGQQPPGFGYPPPDAQQVPPGAPGDGPRFGTPPPGGWGFAPGTDGYATRYGLARPAQGRVVAGVCAALGRASNTDPVLWRVLFAVFTLAGGIGVVLYLLGWLFIPAEGDSGSPVEALLGRGRTSTSPVAIIAVAIGAAVGASVVLTQHRFWSIVVVIGVVAALVVYGSRNGNLPGARQTAGRYGPPPPVPPSGPHAGYPVWSATPTAPPAPTAPARPGPVPPSYRPPFAPHGPYAPTPPPQFPGPLPGGPGYAYPGLVPQPAKAPKPPKQRSKLGVITFSLALVATGVLGLLDLGGLSVPFPAYLAVALAVVGLGMILGTWLGRARGLIGLGLLLAALLGISTLTGHVSGGVHPGVGDVHWTPTTYADVASEYNHGIGDATLDLSAVDFTGQDKTIDVRANIGDTTIILPANVDVVVNARIDAGNAQVFGQNWDGVNTQQHTITDLGTDGAGGGHLVLNVHVNTGQLEVMR